MTSSSTKIAGYIALVLSNLLRTKLTCLSHFLAAPIIESKGMRVDKKDTKGQEKVTNGKKRAKYLKI